MFMIIVFQLVIMGCFSLPFHFHAKTNFSKKEI